MPTIKMNEKEILNFVKSYEGFLAPNPNEYIDYFLKFKGGSVSIYKSGKAVFQGSNLEMFKDYLEKNSEETIENNYDDTPYDYLNTIGADEVGTGDTFGPIVCASVFIPQKDVEKLKKMGVKDSKKLDDKKIIEIAEKLIKDYKFKVSLVRNEIYNDKSSFYNMNEMKARLHDQNLRLLSKEVNYEAVCLDEFVNRKKYFEYLDNNAFKDISFEMKGESKSIAVASASIIARYYFLLEFDRLEKEYGYKFVKGSGKEVNDLIDKIKKDGKNEIFYHTVKMNFKNFKK